MVTGTLLVASPRACRHIPRKEVLWNCMFKGEWHKKACQVAVGPYSAILGSKVGGFASIQSPATFGNYWAKHAHKEPNPRSSTESPKWPIRISA